MKKVLVLLSLVFALALVGCNLLPPALSTGSLKVVVTIPQQLQNLMRDPELMTAGFDVASIKIDVNQNGTITSQTLSLSPNQTSVEATFSSLQVGQCQVTVTVYDNTQHVIYRGSGTGNVVQFNINQVNISLVPENGGLNVQVNIPGNLGVSSGTVRLTHSLNNTNNPNDVKKNLTINGTSGEISFTGLYPTCWQMYVELFNNLGQIVARGEDSIEILPGRTITAMVDVETNGSINIDINWEIPPTKPTGLTAQSATNGVLLTWNANPENNIVGYRIYRSLSETGDKQLLNIDNVTSLQFTDTTASTDTTYWYWVRAIAASGLASDLSLPVYIQYKTQGYGNIEGYAYIYNGNNHSGITVNLNGLTTTTNSNGYYKFTDVATGQYILTVSYSGYYDNNAIVNIEANKLTTVESLYLYPIQAYGSVSGYAKYLDKTNHSKIAVQIRTLDGQLLPGLITETDASGYFYFPEVPVDPSTNTATYIFTAFALDTTITYATDSKEVTVNKNSHTTIPIDFVLRYAGVQVMIFADDKTPWDSSALENMLNQLNVSYQVYTSADIPTVSLPLNKIVWIINDQPQEFYNVYATYQYKFDNFVSNGGTMLFEACDQGWNGGSLLGAGATMPGGVTNELNYCGTNTVINPTHPMMYGVDINLNGSWASHNWFTNLPADHTVLTVDELSHPTLVEYRYNLGRVIATGQPLEYSWQYDQNLRNIYPNMIYYTFNLPIACGVQATVKQTQAPVRNSSGK